MLLPKFHRTLLYVFVASLCATMVIAQGKQNQPVVATQAQSQPAPTGQATPPAANLPSDATKYVTEIIHEELEQEERDHTHWRYRAHREDEKSNSDRDIIETRDGELARTILLWGRPLTADERQRDQERMKKLVEDSEERAKRAKREKEDSDKGHQMFRAIPDAFIFKYDGLENGLVRLTFFPNPHYDPPTRELRVFRALSGKMWIDPNVRHLVRIEGQLFEDVTFGWGILARLNKGGTFNVNMREVGPGHWDMVQLDVNMSGHAVLFKSIAVKQHQTQSEFRRVPDDLTIAQAYEILEKGGAVSANNQTPQEHPHK
jgi:hypothetical protein